MATKKNSPKPLMPKAVAVWLIENTSLTFDQIAEFSGLHTMEIQAIADEETGRRMQGTSPIFSGELTKEEIARCEADQNAILQISRRDDLPASKVRAKGPRYTPVSRRADKPDAIAYLLKFNPEIPDSQICKLVGTTKPTIAAVRDRTHPSASSLRPRHPAEIGLCTYEEMEKSSRRALKAMGKDPDVEAARRADEKAKSEAADQPREEKKSGFDFSNFLGGSGNSNTGSY